MRHGSRNQPVEQVCSNDIDNPCGQNAKGGGQDQEVPGGVRGRHKGVL